MTGLPPPSARKLGLVIDLDTCVGCHACVTNCKEWNRGGLMAPLTRYSFYVQQSGMSDPPLHRIPFAAATFHVNAGYRFP